ncbi:Zn-ribbon domain-containing OB-fold protein [Variovorax sp. Root473]|uniref:Zn-ribbon domain-containing OB-fold protein n=1 Tax=Variovorax sp. Root473 TaxID=1736541 RepID=UPI0006F1C764|nr:OB-fold domain-containing protein [Variovorax sp. Root473]KQX95821.1 DNA-binding protein [Variovorax sp. Root473]
MTTPYVERPLAAPLVDASSEAFWSAARDGRLTTRRCQSCGKLHWYPRPICPYCQGDTDWEALSGLGSVYSVSVTRKAGPHAYAIAYVTLDEGITVLSNIVDCDLDTVRIGQRVKVVFKSAEDGQPVPMFAPA